MAAHPIPWGKYNDGFAGQLFKKPLQVAVGVMMKKSIPRALLFISISLISSAGVTAPSELTWSKISSISGGWTQSHLRVTTTSPFYNPSSCSMTDGYVVEADLPGANLLQSMLITAYATGDDVMLTIDGCALERPKIIGVAIRKHGFP